jgi:hypothetical protein
LIPLDLATDHLPAADIQMTATGTLVTRATPADRYGYSFFDVQLSEYDNDPAVRADVQVSGEWRGRGKELYLIDIF